MSSDGAKLEVVPAASPCPCDSGKPHGECCATSDSTRWHLFTFPDGRSAHFQVHQPATSLVRTVAPPYAEFLIRVVGLAMAAALRPDAGEYEGLVALLVTATALEGVVNRLLEPLMTPEQWAKVERKKSHESKWEMLYGRLKIKPGLNADRQPLAGLREVIAARNRLIHYKHGEHVETFEMPTPSEWKLGAEGGELHVRLPRQLPQLPETILRSIMAPAKAIDYADALVAMARPALAVHPSDSFGVAANLTNEIARLEEAIRTRPRDAGSTGRDARRYAAPACVWRAANHCCPRGHWSSGALVPVGIRRRSASAHVLGCRAGFGPVFRVGRSKRSPQQARSRLVPRLGLGVGVLVVGGAHQSAGICSQRAAGIAWLRRPAGQDAIA